MKKMYSSILAVLLLVANVSIVQAEEVSKQGDSIGRSYATPYDMLLNFIREPVMEIVQEKYGKSVAWNFSKITEIQHVYYTEKRVEGATNWYEFTVDIFIKEPDKKGWGIDRLTFKIMPDAYKNKSAKNTSGDVHFKLMDYKHITPK